MKRYHITDEGNAGLCKAEQGRCPFGTAKDHWSSAEDAREYYELLQTKEDLFAAAMRKNPSYAAAEKIIEANSRTRYALARAYADSPAVSEEFVDASKEELEAYNESYREYEKTLTEAEKAHLYSYTGISYDPVNSYLREEEAFLAKANPNQVQLVQKEIEGLDSALAKSPSPKGRVFRRLDQGNKKLVVGSEEWAEALGFVPGKTVHFKSYSSTSVNPGYIARTTQDDAHTSVVLAIDDAKGAPVSLTVYDRDRTHTQEGEAEVLLPRDSSFEVTRVERAAYRSEGFERVEVLTVFLTHSSPQQ